MRRRTVFALVLAAALAGLGCPDLHIDRPSSGPAPSDSVATPSFTADIQPILTRSCALGSGCHSAGGTCNLELESGLSIGSLVGVTSVCANPPITRVMPGFTDSSLFALVLDSTTRSISRMPLLGDTLSQGERGTIRNWIRQGAQSN